MFDEQPDGDPHGECAAEIHRLTDLVRWAYSNYHSKHCQEGGELCRAGQRDGTVCPPESCDIDDGVRPPDGVGEVPRG